MTDFPHGADAIIIGGGLHGLSTALHLALAGVKAIIIEKDHIGRHASSANAGGVRSLGRALPEIPLITAALERWHNIADLVDDDCGFTHTGQIKVAETEAGVQALKARRQELLNIGFEHEEIIDQKQLRKLLPEVAHHCLGAMIVHSDGHANPFQTVLAFRRKAQSLGVRILENCPVSAIHRHGQKWRMSTPHGSIEAPVVVNCAGAWGGEIAAQLGDHAPVEAQALMLMISERVRPFIKPVVGVQERALSFKQFDNGTVLIGGAYQGRAKPEENRTNLDFHGLAANAASTVTIFPIMRKARIMRCWAGIEGVMPDNIPVVGKGSVSGAYHAFGFSAHGFALTPVVGKIIADLVVVGMTNLPIKSFSIERFENQQ